MKEDVLDMLSDLHRSGSFVKSINVTFTVLVPKKERAKDISDFRPISLVSRLYKLITKVLANRLSKILHLLIDECQHVFVAGRQISDTFMIANDVVDGMVHNKRSGILCKLEKAFDHVCWNFVDYLLYRHGFRYKWRKWIKSCIATTSFAVMINGGPSVFFF